MELFDLLTVCKQMTDDELAGELYVAIVKKSWRPKPRVTLRLPFQ